MATAVLYADRQLELLTNGDIFEESPSTTSDDHSSEDDNSKVSIEEILLDAEPPADDTKHEAETGKENEEVDTTVDETDPSTEKEDIDNIEEEDQDKIEMNSIGGGGKDADDEYDADDDSGKSSCSSDTMDVPTDASTPDLQRQSRGAAFPPLTPISVRTLTPTYSLNESTASSSSSRSSMERSPPPTPSSPTENSPAVRPCRSRTLLSSKMRNASTSSVDHQLSRSTSLYNKPLKRSMSGRDFNNSSFHLNYKSHCEKEQAEGATPESCDITRLLHEAVYHQNIVLQASQALNIADLFNIDGKKSTSAILEAERILLLESERRALCLDEVKRLKESARKGNVRCTGSLSLSDMKLSLRGDEVASVFRRSGKTLHFVVLASAGYGNVTTTEVVSEGWASGSEHFTVPLTDVKLNDLHHDFQLCLKVMGLWTHRDNADTIINNDNYDKNMDDDIKNNNANSDINNNSSTKNNTSFHNTSMRKLKEKVLDRNINGMLFNNKKRNDEDVLTNASTTTTTTQQTDSKQPQTIFRKTNFRLLGETTVDLKGVRNGRSRYELHNPNHACTLDVHIVTSLEVGYGVDRCGVVTVKEFVGGVPEWKDRWCRLRGDAINYWTQREDETTKPPLHNIDLRLCVASEVAVLPPSMCARPHTVEVALLKGSHTMEYWICCGNEDNCGQWLGAINKQLGDYMAWR